MSDDDSNQTHNAARVRPVSSARTGTRTRVVLGRPRTVEPEAELDQRYSRDWAITGLVSGGAIASFAVFDLVNVVTGQGHKLWLGGGGLLNFGVSSGAALDSNPPYTRFRTPRPVSHQHFDGAGGRLSSLSVGLGIGYSWAYLSLWTDQESLCSSLDVGGWGAMPLPSGSVVIGACKIQYGNGQPFGQL